MLRATLMIGLWCVSMMFSAAHARPFIPANGAQVIEHLPGRNDPVQQEFKRLRAALAVTPNNLPLALDLARRYIDQARSEGDPRYLGYAEAVLAPWWKQAQAPTEVRVLRATLLQSTHQFPQALAELNTVLQTDRDNAQAWLTRATILLVQGEYEQAKSSCAKLYPLAPELITLACLTNVASLSGEGMKSYALLHAALKRNIEVEPGIKIWVLTLLAEMAHRNGDEAAAESHFRQALMLNRADSYLLAAYADTLLDQQRPAEAAALVKNHIRADALLLRYALALKAQASPDAAAHIDALRARFDAAMRRGDTIHQREQARFELQLRNAPKTALKFAQQNWQVQKEPADVRIFLEAAVAAQDPAAALPVSNWLKKSRLEDHALAPLIAKLGES